MLLSAPGPAAASTHVRVDQVGYSTAGPKRAYLLAATGARGARFTVRNAAGAAVLSGKVGPRTRAWSRRFPTVRRIDFDRLTAPGTYTLAVSGPVRASSPPFRVAGAAELLTPMIADSRFFFAAQRDGADMGPAVLGRLPSHLNDAHAYVYAPPAYDSDGELQRDLRRIGGPIDAEGGWFDAGDYVKFVQTQSYAVDVLLLGLRDHPAQMGPGNTTGGDFTDEAKFGLQWLMKMWDDRAGVLYYQVGIGDANGCGSICGDHDVWRLPQADDSWPGGAAYRYIRNRPLFRAGPASARVSPNLAGRLAAAFALCSEVYRATDPALAARCLHAGIHVYARADTHPDRLLTAEPHDFYPESSWQDDMELGAVALHHAGAPGPYLQRAARWARAWIRGRQGGDTLNLYDTSALAHFELHKAITAAGRPRGLAVSQRALLRDLRSQLDGAVVHSHRDAFRAGFAWDQYDVTSHLLGLVTMATMYDELTGTRHYAGFAGRQLGAALGANAWGVSFVVGSGTTFAHCMQHQVANLVGSLDGTPPLVRGAVVNGSNDVSQFEGSSDTPGDARACPAGGGDAFARFTGRTGARFQDNVGAWMSVEPAIDFTAGLPLALSQLIAADPYRSADRPRFVIWARAKAGGWSFWRDGPRLAATHGFGRAALELPKVPAGVSALSVGVALSGNGQLTVRKLALRRR